MAELYPVAERAIASRLAPPPEAVLEVARSSGPTEVEAADEVLDIGIGDDILVADDSPTNLIAMESALAPLGRRIVTVGSGTEALAKLLEQDFALIFLDVSMPGITGIETARLIRSRPKSRGTPIVFVTGMEWKDESVDAAYEAGGFDFMVKPVRPEVLRAKACVFLKLQERTRELRQREAALRISQARLYEHELAEQRQRFESELLDAQVSQLAEVDRRQQQLAGLIGNELLNPLQTLQMAFELLRAHPNAEKGERICSLVEHRLVHVTRLVKVLIDVARVSAGQLELHVETVNLADIVKQALDDCRALLATRRITARLEADAIGPLVMGDPTHLLQAMTTLIDQAAQATAEGGELTARVMIAGGDVVVGVSGTGRSTPALGTPALNLGMTLVRRLVDLHDGAIRVQADGPPDFELRLALAPQEVELSSLDVYASQEVATISPEQQATTTMRMTAVMGVPAISDAVAELLIGDEDATVPPRR